MKARSESAGLYLAIARSLRQKIREDYKPGDKLPSERELAVQFGVHRNTMRRTLEELNRAGVIATSWGARSVVVKRPLDHRISFETSFTNSALAAGKEPRTILVSTSTLPSRASQQICRKLVQCEADGEAITVRYIDDEPICWIRHLLFGIDVTEALSGFDDGSMHDWLARTLGGKPRRIESTIGADRATSTDCKLLTIPRGSSMLYANSINRHPITDAVVEVSLTRFRGGAAELKVKL